MMDSDDLRVLVHKYQEIRRAKYRKINECIDKYGSSPEKNKIKKQLENEFNFIRDASISVKEQIVLKEFELSEEDVIKKMVEEARIELGRW